ncbi:MAG: S24 family peptidase [Dehalococcoidia bacterium]
MAVAASRRRRKSGIRSGLSLGAAIVLVAFAWFFFAPVQLGGTFSYFQIVGDSMEPTITRGDLVLLRDRDRYEVGDMVAYVDPDLGTVLHRIRAVEGNHYVLRGDNRDADDSYQPLEDEVTGAVWQILPGGGDALSALQSPASAIFLGGSSLIMGAISWGRRATRGEQPRRTRAAKGQRPPLGGASGRIADRSPAGGTLLSAAGLSLVLAALAGMLVIVNPPERVVMDDFAYEHMGAFSYTGVAGRGVYDGNEVSTGDPVFTRMTTSVPITFDYDIAPITDGLEIVAPEGALRLDAVVSQDNGWQRTVQLTDWTPFVGHEGTISGDLALDEILALTKMMEEFSGLAYPTYTVEVVATADVRGDVARQPFKGEFVTSMRFLLSDAQLMPAVNFAPESMDPVTLTRPVERPWSLDVPVFGVSVEWGMMRLVAILAGLLSLALVGAVLGSTALAARSGEVTLIAARYGAFIVDAASTEVTFAGRRVEVQRIEDLVKIARQDGLFIVHEHDQREDEYGVTRSTHRYHLVQPDVTYTYTAGVRTVLDPGVPR